MKSLVRRMADLREDDGGAMLILALIVVTTVALVTGVVLAQSWTNVSATITLRAVAGTSYAGDAAAKEAINDLVLGSGSPDWVTPSFSGTWSDWGWVFTNYSDSTGCFGVTGTSASPVPTNTLELDNFYPKSGSQTSDSSVRVECAPVPGTGILSGGAGNDIADPNSTDPFSRALTTLGTLLDPHNGVAIDVQGGGNDNVAPIGGGVISKTNIAVTHGSIATNGYVYANGLCSGVIATDVQCPKVGGVATPTVPTSPLAPAGGGTGVVPPTQNPLALATPCEFQPGSYFSGTDLTTATDGCNVAHFASGVYYFDFLDGQPWTIDHEVVGGECSTGSTCGSASGSAISIPGACKSPIGSGAAVAGIQIVFAGSSSISVDKNNGNAEFCGPSNGGAATMTLYQETGTSPPAPVTLSAKTSNNVTQPVGPATQDSFVPTGGASPTLTGALSATGGATANWKSTADGDTGALDLQDFSVPSPGWSSIPAGDVIAKATLKLTYASNLSGTDTFTAGVSGVPGRVPVAASGSDTDITTLLNSALASGAFTSTNPAIQLRVSARNNHTLNIDAAQLTVTYVDATPASASNTTFLTSGNNIKGDFVVQGSTYVPKGYIDLSPGQTSSTVAFRWGLVAQGINVKTYPQQLFGYPLVSIPTPGPSLGSLVTGVDLKVFVCVQSSSCASPNGKQTLAVRALVTDPPYGAAGHPTPGQRQVQIVSWAEQR